MNKEYYKVLNRTAAIACCVIAVGCSNASSNKSASLAPTPTKKPTATLGLASNPDYDPDLPLIVPSAVLTSKNHTSDQTKFSSLEYGVKGSPRVSTAKRMKKGGGSYKIGKPYWIRGKKYVPREDPNYKATGLASWYGPNFHGRLTANGEVYDQYGLSAAHPTMPLPSYAKVTNLENGASVIVRVNDRGPYAHNRAIDLSSRAAQLLGYTKKGVAQVKIEYVGKARMDGEDEQYLVASYNPGSLNPNSIPPNPAGQTLFANNSNKKRTTLQSYASAGFSAPLPQMRPVTDNGHPVDVTALNTPRPATLVRGYMDETSNNAEIFTRFDELPRIMPPNDGMDSLSQVRIGPLYEEHEIEALEKKLLAHGPVTIVKNTDGNGVHILHSFFAVNNYNINVISEFLLLDSSLISDATETN